MIPPLSRDGERFSAWGSVLFTRQAGSRPRVRGTKPWTNRYLKPVRLQGAVQTLVPDCAELPHVRKTEAGFLGQAADV